MLPVPSKRSRGPRCVQNPGSRAGTGGGRWCHPRASRAGAAPQGLHAARLQKKRMSWSGLDLGVKSSTPAFICLFVISYLASWDGGSEGERKAGRRGLRGNHTPFLMSSFPYLHLPLLARSFFFFYNLPPLPDTRKLVRLLQRRRLHSAWRRKSQSQSSQWENCSIDAEC